MAVTSIWPITGRVDKVINYARNPEKTHDKEKLSELHEIEGVVELGEISGSETFLHVRSEHFLLVLHLPGVHEYDVDAPIRVYIPTHKLFVFDGQGRLVQAPGRRVSRVA